MGIRRLLRWMRAACGVFGAFLLVCSHLEAQVLLNELLADNGNSLADDDGDFPDWAELVNVGSSRVSLLDYALTDDPAVPRRWAFPDIPLPPQGHLLVWLSGKNRYVLPPVALDEGSGSAFRPSFVRIGDEWRYLVGDPASAGPPAAWKDLDFDDSTWSLGCTGIGYGDGDDATEVPPDSAVVFLRRRFNVPNREGLSTLILRMDFDDGFVAYLNGVRVASEGAAAGDPSFQSTATIKREAGSPALYDLSSSIELLQTGDNILCIAGLNDIPSTDMSILPELGTVPPFLHANFQLERSGEQLILSDAAGVEIDRVAFGEQTRDHSFGRTDGGEWRYFLVPTPEAPNEGPSFSNALPDAVAFSPDSGRFSSPFQLRLELNRPGSGEVVRYTLDGSAPTAASLVYTAPITVGSNTVFSAAGFADGVRATSVSARSYFFGGSYQLPVLSISMNPVDYFDLHTSETGRGRLSEKPAFLEYFEPVLQRAAAAPMGLRLHGGAGRGGDFETKKSYRCYFRGEYGMRRFDYPIIPDAPEPEFDRLVLRAGFNDAFRTSSRAAYIRDQLIRDLHEDMGGIVAHGSWCDLFVNMKFRGLYNVVERIDERFLAAATGEKDWDVIRTGNEVVSGTADEWDRLRAFCLQNDLAQESIYRIVETMVDVPNFTSYMLVNIWAQNHDWISNNWYAARPRRSDGKWIFLCWDGEFGVGLIPPGSGANTFEFIFERSGNLRDIFESLLASPIFRSFFAEEADRYAYGALIRENVVRHIDLLVEKVAGDIPEEVALYGQPVSHWAANVEECRAFAGSRLPVFLDSILKSTRFEFPEVRTPRITGCEPETIVNRGEQSVTLTGVRLTESTLVFFNEVPAPSVEAMGLARVRAELPFDLSLEGPITIHARNEPGGTTSTTDGLLSILLPRPVAVQIVPARGSSSGGDRVRIDGASFLPGVRVEFDGVPAPDVSIVPDSPQALEIVTPPGSGDANVVVWNPVVGGAVPSFSRLKFTYIEQRFRRGDANGDGRVDVSDPISILGYLFSGDATLPCGDAADANDTGIVDLSDAVYTLVFLFQGGREPPSPFTACGEDATSDALACDHPRGCGS